VGSREIAVAQAVAAYEAANATLAAIGEAVVDALAGIAAYEEEVRRRKILVALAIESLEAVADEMEVAMTARSEVELRSEAANASYARQEVGALSASQLALLQLPQLSPTPTSYSSIYLTNLQISCSLSYFWGLASQVLSSN